MSVYGMLGTHWQYMCAKKARQHSSASRPACRSSLHLQEAGPLAGRPGVRRHCHFPVLNKAARLLQTPTVTVSWVLSLLPCCYACATPQGCEPALGEELGCKCPLVCKHRLWCALLVLFWCQN